VMTPLTFPGKERLFCVVAKDCDGLSTPEIYRAFDEGCAMDAPSSGDAVIRALSVGDHKTFFSLMKNSLESPAIALCPDVARVKARILSLGAECAMMTGSGSAVFGLFADEKTARSAAETLKKECREAHFCTLL
ncbi:MAG: hypothetical protein IKC69_03535, partial [Clostridia bacterium]|nr:hypothetical protein [Clostridia bacterium]